MATFTEEKVSPIIGIDLGTTYSCVGAFDEATQKVVIFNNSIGERTTPSWVGFTEQGRVVGQAAKSQQAVNSANTVYDVKRIIGRSMEDPVTREEAKRFPYKLEDGGDGRPIIEVSLRGEKVRMSPEEISSVVLLEMKRAAESALGVTVSKAVITVPAHFNDQQRQATKDAGKIAGLEVMRIINEPTAAALAYGLHSGNAAATVDKSNVLIFDLGGGTFDVSVLSMEGGVFTVKATGGDTHLGGEDVDNVLVDYCLKQIGEKFNQNASKAIKASHRNSQRLRKACEQAKRDLSGATTTTIEVSALVDGADFSLELTRAQMDKLCKDLYDRCINTVKSVISDAKTTLDKVSEVVLVGGSTRIVTLQEELLKLFDNRIELCKTINPDEAVAYGAAVQGAILLAGQTGGAEALGADASSSRLKGGLSTDLVLLDVTPLSLGIELEGKVMSVLIPRNTPIPCVKSREYSTCDDYQTEIDVVVYEGERPHTSANNKLGDFMISGIERAKRGEPKVEVTFALDANGILSVTALDKVTGATANAEIKADRGRLSDSDIDRMIADAERYREEDEKLAKLIALRNNIEEAVYDMKSRCVESNDIMGLSQLDDVMEWIEDSEAFESATHAELCAKADMLNNKFGIKIDTSSRQRRGKM
jgi:heat shock 70kDa protein 1/2/6/8